MYKYIVIMNKYAKLSQWKIGRTLCKKSVKANNFVLLPTEFLS